MIDKKILRIRQVLDKAGISKSAMYEQVAAGTFPPPIKLSSRSSGWLNSEVEDWIDERVRLRG